MIYLFVYYDEINKDNFMYLCVLFLFSNLLGYFKLWKFIVFDVYVE